MNINISWNLPEKKKDQVREEHETCGDKEYAACFREIVIPVLKLYDPELILVSCGFDSGKGDPIGQLQLTEIGYSFMTR